MNKYYIAILIAVLVVGISVGVAYSESFSKFSKKDGDVFKIFEDGVTYKKVDNFWDTSTHILYKGVDYRCNEREGYSGIISPVCVEIILRSLPQNQP